MESQFARLLVLALVTGVGGATAQPSSEMSISLVGPRVGLTAWYAISEGGEVTERCQEDRYPNRSVRIECSTGGSVSVRIDNVESNAHYELTGTTWTRYLLRPTPTPRLFTPSRMLRPLGEDDSRSALVRVLPPEHRRAYVWTPGSERETVVVPSLDWLTLWRRDRGGRVVQLTEVSIEPPVGALSPPSDAAVRVDRRANRTRLF